MRKIGWTGFLLLVLVPAGLVAAQAVRLAVTLKHRDARSVLARVTQELGPKGRITVDGERNRIVVEDEAPNVQKVARLLVQLDQPARRFALAARLEIFPAPPAAGLFDRGGTVVDMDAWLKGSKPEATFSALMNFEEGGLAAAPLGIEYELTVAAGGYDPSQNRLNLRTLSLWRGRGQSRRSLLSGAAALPEGQTTAIVMGAGSGQPPMRLHLNPSLLPKVEGKGEIPR